VVTSRQAGAAGRKAGARRRGTWAREKIYICYSMLLCTKRETRAVSRSRCLHHAPPLPPPPPPCVVRSSKARLKTTDSIGFSASACAGFACSHGTETFNALEYCKAQPHHQQWSRISDASTHASTQARKHSYRRAGAVPGSRPLRRNYTRHTWCVLHVLHVPVHRLPGFCPRYQSSVPPRGPHAQRVAAASSHPASSRCIMPHACERVK
jgi:hypothetical protein